MTIYSDLPVLSEIQIENLARVAPRPNEPTVYRVEDIPEHLFPVVSEVDRDFFRTHPKSITFGNGETAYYDRESRWVSTEPYYQYMGHRVSAKDILKALNTDQVSSFEPFVESDLMYA